MKQKIEAMIGHTYLYNGAEKRIKAIEEYEDDLLKVKFFTGEQLTLSEEELIKDFMPVEHANEAALAIISGVQIESKSLQDLSAILMKNLQKVQDDPGYVKQAHAVNESAKQIIEIKKAQLEMFKLVKELN